MQSSSPLSQKISLIQNEINAANTLLVTLKHEFEALQGSITPDKISSLAAQKEQQLIDMERSTQARISQISTADPLLASEPLSSLWKMLHKLALACQHQNQLNGGIINTTKRHVEQATTILHGKTPASELRYGSAGETVTETSRRTLAKA